jgi:uncharacterized RDD family membrane protein YckC
MPKAAIERGYATRVIALDVLPATLQTLCARNVSRGEIGAPRKAFRAGI